MTGTSAGGDGGSDGGDACSLGCMDGGAVVGAVKPARLKMIIRRERVLDV